MAVIIPLRVEIASEMTVRRCRRFRERDGRAGPARSCCANLGRHLVEPIGVGNGVHRIEAQAVEAIFHQPIKAFSVKKRRTSLRRKSIAGPHGVDTSLRNISGAIGRQIIAVGAEVIIDDVEKDHQAELVRGVDRAPSGRRACRSCTRARRAARRRSPNCARPGIRRSASARSAVTPRSASRGNSRATPAKPPSMPACNS